MAGGAGRLQQRILAERCPRPCSSCSRRRKKQLSSPDRRIRDPDQQDHALASRLPAANDTAGERDRPIVGEHAGEGEQHREARGDECAEFDQQDDRARPAAAEDLARGKSLLRVSFSSWLALRKPSSATVMPSWRPATFRPHSGSAGPCSSAFSWSPAISNWTRPSGRSLEIWPPFPGDERRADVLRRSAAPRPSGPRPPPRHGTRHRRGVCVSDSTSTLSPVRSGKRHRQQHGFRCLRLAGGGVGVLQHLRSRD